MKTLTEVKKELKNLGFLGGKLASLVERNQQYIMQYAYSYDEFGKPYGYILIGTRTHAFLLHNNNRPESVDAELQAIERVVCDGLGVANFYKTPTTEKPAMFSDIEDTSLNGKEIMFSDFRYSIKAKANYSIGDYSWNYKFVAKIPARIRKDHVDVHLSDKNVAVFEWVELGHVVYYIVLPIKAKATPVNDKKEEPKKVEEPAKVEEPTPEVDPSAEEPVEINLDGMTPENVSEYKDAIYLMAMSDNHNTGIIMQAIMDANLDTPEILFNYAMDDVLPNFHTFDAWKKAGYKVKKGSKAMFTARIWKSVIKKSEPLTEKQAAELNTIVKNSDGEEYKAGDQTESSKWIKKLAFFFGPDQVEKMPSGKIELPNDCTMTKDGNKEVVTGNTKPIKEDLKKAGFYWQKKTSSWVRYVA